MSQQPNEPLADRMVTPERSVFGTRLPRPTGVGRHLIIVVALVVVALVVAIYFAEASSSDSSSDDVPVQTR